MLATLDQANDVACKVSKEVVVEEIFDDDAWGEPPMDNKKIKPVIHEDLHGKNSRANRKH